MYSEFIRAIHLKTLAAVAGNEVAESAEREPKQQRDRL